jgi:DNA-binding NtrC family response regulator
MTEPNEPSIIPGQDVRRVLVVDDNPDMLFRVKNIVMRALGLAEGEVCTLSSGKEVEAMLTAGLFDHLEVAVIDLCNPGTTRWGDRFLLNLRDNAPQCFKILYSTQVRGEHDVPTQPGVIDAFVSADYKRRDWIGQMEAALRRHTHAALLS